MTGKGMEDEMLIEQYDVDVFTPPCEPGAERYSAIARLTSDISEVLPLLNATLRGAVYHLTANALTWKKGGHNIAFHAYEIATSNVEDREAAEKELKGLIELVNRTWERRAEIDPDYETHQRPTPMAIYKLLPQTNCKQCGEPTCYTFAIKLAVAQVKLADCPLLFESRYEQNLAELEGIVIDAPAVGRGDKKNE
jgi:ArsR family metal-binding transcriptional regulator